MGYLFTRRQLYELVWAEPIVALAKSLGISDVGLAKACRRGDIPLPPRGYWARLNAGKSVIRPPLSLRAPGASDRIHVGPNRPQAFRPHGGDESTIRDLPPQPPVYDETLDAVEARIQQGLPAKHRFVRALDSAHPQVARLLREDDERREAMTKNRYTFDKPRFENRFERRRLAFLSNLFVLLGRLEAQGSAYGRDGRELGVHVGDQYVRFKVETLATLRPGKRPTEAKSEPMAIEIEVARWQHGELRELLFWSDGEDGRLEDRLPEIGVAIVLAGERQYRKSRQFSYECARQSFEEEVKRARMARDEAERREREARLQAERDRITRLLAQVSAWQQAQQIRAYVEAVLTSPVSVPGRAFDGERDAWAHWARAVANGLDPLASSEPAAPHPADKCNPNG
ncbi:hypothetical protein [Paraburkholderia sp. BR13444]|uniref:hypothetical protein n=1 Tax=Paraburkholderia sp. BR13444 TaxID=3236997 RepID=UPI0034CE18E7